MQNLYVKPHNKIAAEVTEEHYDFVQVEAEQMLKLCNQRHGVHNGAYAIAHPQINDRTPLRFFITFRGQLVLNPEIIRHTQYEIEKIEGCMSFPDEKPSPVKRYNKVEVKYKTFADGKLTDWKIVNLNGLEAEVWQHEIDHLNAKYIHNI